MQFQVSPMTSAVYVLVAVLSSSSAEYVKVGSNYPTYAMCMRDACKVKQELEKQVEIMEEVRHKEHKPRHIVNINVYCEDANDLVK